MLAYATFVSPDSKRQYWLLALGLEMLLALGGFFSDFKTPLLFTLMAAVAARVRLSVRRCLGLLSLVVVLLSLGVMWTAVKMEYRLFLIAGEGAQVDCRLS